MVEINPNNNIIINRLYYFFSIPFLSSIDSILKLKDTGQTGKVNKIYKRGLQENIQRISTEKD